MKNYDKLLRKISSNIDFIVKARKRTTLKIIHIPTSSCYMSHPGEPGYKPLLRWFKKIGRL